MNFYNILNIEPNATKAEIKKAYHNLAMKYHPDKSKEDKEAANKKFQEVHAAYEILYDDDKRIKYDSLSKEERMQVFDLIKTYLNDINPKGRNFFNTILSTFYHNNEDELRQDLNTFNIKNIFSKITSELINYSEIDENNNIYITLKEKYENKFKYVKIQDINKDSWSSYIVSLSENNFSITHNDQNILINIICNEDPNYQIIDNCDLLYIKKISLSQYLYGGKIKIPHLSGEDILFDFDCCLEKKPIFVIENKGLLKNKHKMGIDRGNLYIYLTIEGVNSIQEDDISIEYAKTIQETLNLMFPPLN